MGVLPSVAALLAAALFPTLPAGAAPADVESADVDKSRIALIIGDQVMLRPGGGVTVAGGPGRDRGALQIMQEDRHTYGPGDVSSRASVTDNHGNTGNVQILHAYHLNG